jgi:hypothetical protein
VDPTSATVLMLRLREAGRWTGSLQISVRAELRAGGVAAGSGLFWSASARALSRFGQAALLWCFRLLLAAPTLALLGCGPAAAPTKPDVRAEDVIAAVETAQNTVQDTAPQSQLNR